MSNHRLRDCLLIVLQLDCGLGPLLPLGEAAVREARQNLFVLGEDFRRWERRSRC